MNDCILIRAQPSRMPIMHERIPHRNTFRTTEICEGILQAIPHKDMVEYIFMCQYINFNECVKSFFLFV